MFCVEIMVNTDILKKNIVYNRLFEEIIVDDLVCGFFSIFYNVLR